MGIAVIAAAAVAMFAFAKSMDSATSSVKSFNSATESTPSRVHSIQRAGEATIRGGTSGTDEYALYRRGVE